ncbi:MAG: TonB-dependent receptor [Bacillus subtilis]|nr:TonB-dependent receptor [Bacillus subtilis]
MSEINIGRYITFIPVSGFEKTYLKYDAYIAEAIPDGNNRDEPVEFRDTTANNNYNTLFFSLRSIRIKPTSWFDIRLAYTNTLSRADYNQLALKELVSLTSRTVVLGNTGLKPAASENFDAIFSFYHQRFGLLTVGAFKKILRVFMEQKRSHPYRN